MASTLQALRPGCRKQSCGRGSFPASNSRTCTACRSCVNLRLSTILKCQQCNALSALKTCSQDIKPHQTALCSASFRNNCYNPPKRHVTNCF